ncbi:MAG: nickel-dependent hydrogenase large subunit [Solirubrobacterales bacterium]
MAQKVVVDPVTRIEGHLKVEVEIDGGKVVDARTSGSLFRGLELIMRGRDPRDAQQLIQRICGVCPLAHATAGTMALDTAFGIEPPHNGRIVRNLIFGSNYLQSHILHFFHLTALDYVKGPDMAPWRPLYGNDFRLPEATNKAAVDAYIKALEIRRKCHEMLALWGGRMPHVQAIVPGGVTQPVDAQKIAEFTWRLAEVKSFVENVYIPIATAVTEAYSDWFSLGVGCKSFLAYGGFPTTDAAVGTKHVDREKFFKTGIVYANGTSEAFDPELVTEQVKYAWFADGIELSPKDAVVKPEATKAGAYSWLKAPRYKDMPMEVGPLSRQLVNGTDAITNLGDKAFSVMGRHFARAVEALLIATEMQKWLGELDPSPNAPVCTPHEFKGIEVQGMGLTEGPRGALGHWHKFNSSNRTEVYNAVVPTTWNAGPRDDKGVPGPMEQAIIGVPVADATQPVEVLRVIRSMDPCFGCAIHVMTPDKKTIAQFTID